MITPPAGRTKEHTRALTFLLAGMATIGPFAIDTYLPSFLEIGQSLHASQLAVQQTLSAYLVPFAIMTLLHGAISDALGRRRVVLAALALFAFSSLGCVFARSIQALWFFRALQGTTAGAGMIVGRAVIRDLFEGKEAHRKMAQVTFLFAVAPAVAPVIGGQLHAWFGWRSVFAFLTLFASLLWFWCLKQLPETLPRENRQPLHPVYLARSCWGVLTTSRFFVTSLAVALNFCGFFVYVTSAPVFLLRHLKVKETEFLWLFGPSTLGMMLGSWITSQVAGRLKHQTIVGCGSLVMGLSALWNLGLNLRPAIELPWAVAPLFFYTLGMALAMPSLTLVALDLFPHKRGLAASCQGFIQTATSSLTAALIAPAVCVSTLRLAASQLAFLLLGSTALVLVSWWNRPGRRGRIIRI